MQSKQLEKLRERYPTFIYQDFLWKIKKNKLHMEFNYLIQPDIEFCHVIDIINPYDKWEQLSLHLIDRIVFNIGLVESFSYWKVACPQNVIIRPHPMSSSEVLLWRNLMEYGMGEFFYKNNIDFRGEDFVVLHHNSYVPSRVQRIVCERDKTRPLLMLSGGKDSTFSAYFLRSINEDFLCMMVNPTKSAWRIASIMGCNTPIVVERHIDQRLLRLNEQGYLNGHIPFSASLAIIGLLCATLYGCDMVISSQEYGSSLPYVKHLQHDVNHQYSKSLHFENFFNKYIAKELITDIEYFSLIRPFREIQVIHHLIKSDLKLFAASKSCNRMLNEDRWCLKCPKCLSVFTLAYPFLSTEEVEGIFGGNAFNELANLNLIEKLFAVNGNNRPFECVAPPDELKVAIWLGLKKHVAKNEPLPPVLNFAKTFLAGNNVSEDSIMKTMCFWSDKHSLPSHYEPILKKIVEPNYCYV